MCQCARPASLYIGPHRNLMLCPVATALVVPLPGPHLCLCKTPMCRPHPSSVSNGQATFKPCTCATTAVAELQCLQVGDQVVVDGGMVSLEVVSKAGPDTHCKVVDPGLILSRANLTFRREGEIIRARNAMLPVLSSKVSAGATVEFAAVNLDLLPSCKFMACCAASSASKARQQ